MKEIKLIAIEPTENDVAAQLQENKKILKKIQQENENREMHRKVMFTMTVIMTSALLLGLGIIIGRALGFLYAVGC